MKIKSLYLTVWKFHDFLSLRFYVKSSLYVESNQEVLKLSFLPFLGALNFGELGNYQLEIQGP